MAVSSYTVSEIVAPSVWVLHSSKWPWKLI